MSSQGPYLKKEFLLSLTLAAVFIGGCGARILQEAPLEKPPLSADQPGLSSPREGGDIFEFSSRRGEPVVLDLNAFIHEGLSGDFDRFRGALAKVQKHGEDAVNTIKDEYARLPEHRYFERWLLVNTAAHVVHPSAVTFFTEIVKREIPPAKSKDTHHFSTVDEELVISLAAIGGLERLSKKCCNDSMVSLREIIATVKYYSVRQEAVLAYLASSPNKAAAGEELKGILPPELHYMLKVQRVGGPPPPKIPSAPKRRLKGIQE